MQCLPVVPLLMLVQAARPPALQAGLLADRDAIAPGAQVELAIPVEIEPGWHIYHRNTLGNGLPTTFEFTLPPGFSVGEVRYPTPKLGTFAGLEFLGYEGRAVFLATLSADERAPVGQTVTIGVRVRALACRESCVPVEASARLELPVRTEPAGEANAELFASARKRMPPPLHAAPQIRAARVLLSQEPVRLNDEFVLAVEIDLEKGWHIQARDPGVEGLIASRLYIEPIDGLRIDLDRQQWSAPRTVDVAGFGKVRQYDGRVIIRTPLKLTDSRFPRGPATLRLLFEYQACNDAGQCLFPQMAEATVNWEVAAPDATVRRSDDPVFAAALGGDTGAGGATGAGARGTAGGAPAPLVWVFLGAFVGGAILNVMPCVLPVVSLKIFGFIRQAGESRARVLALGLTYAAGIVASFAVLAIVMVRARLAWGGLMQEPAFIIVMGAVMVCFALSLWGVYEIRLPGRVACALGEAGAREGFAGAFFNGVLATALATPCTAPFLGWALGILIQLEPLAAGAGILTVGLGLAAPYVILTAFPAWIRFVPKPGHWMITFKQFLGFALLGTVIWLLSVLFDLVDKGRFFTALVFYGGLGAACWMIGRIGLTDSRGRAAATWAAALAVAALAWFVPERAFRQDLTWYAWQPGLPERLSGQGYAVYVDFTATWCLTCQANKLGVLNRPAVRERFRQNGVVPLKADFTRRSPRIQAELERYGRAGVPLNVVLPPGRPDEPIILPEVLTRGIVFEALERAGRSTNPAPPDLARADDAPHGGDAAP